MNNVKWLENLLSPENKLDVERFGMTKVSVGWHLQQRRIPEHYLTFILKGTMYVRLGEEEWVLNPGAFTYVAPGIAHTMRPEVADTPHTFFHLRFYLVSGKNNLRPEPDSVIIPKAGHMKQLMNQLFDEYRLEKPYSEIRFRSLLTSVCAEVFRNSSPEQAEYDNLLTPAQKRACLEHVISKLKDDIHPKELAQLLGYSHDYFTRLFRKSTGVAPRTWIMQQRINQAAMMLEESTGSISEIACEAGYTDIFYFSRQFKQIFGCSPRNYRYRIAGTNKRRS